MMKGLLLLFLLSQLFIKSFGLKQCKTDKNNCDSNAKCIDTPTSFICQCNFGYKGMQ